MNFNGNNTTTKTPPPPILAPPSLPPLDWESFLGWKNDGERLPPLSAVKFISTPTANGVILTLLAGEGGEGEEESGKKGGDAGSSNTEPVPLAALNISNSSLTEAELNSSSSQILNTTLPLSNGTAKVDQEEEEVVVNKISADHLSSSSISTAAIVVFGKTSIPINMANQLAFALPQRLSVLAFAHQLDEALSKTISYADSLLNSTSSGGKENSTESNAGDGISNRDNTTTTTSLIHVPETHPKAWVSKLEFSFESVKTVDKSLPFLVLSSLAFSLVLSLFCLRFIVEEVIVWYYKGAAAVTISPSAKSAETSPQEKEPAKPSETETAAHLSTETTSSSEITTSESSLSSSHAIPTITETKTESASATPSPPSPLPLSVQQRESASSDTKKTAESSSADKDSTAASSNALTASSSLSSSPAPSSYIVNRYQELFGSKERVVKTIIRFLVANTFSMAM